MRKQGHREEQKCEHSHTIILQLHTDTAGNDQLFWPKHGK